MPRTAAHGRFGMLYAALIKVLVSTMQVAHRHLFTLLQNP